MAELPEQHDMDHQFSVARGLSQRQCDTKSRKQGKYVPAQNIRVRAWCGDGMQVKHIRNKYGDYFGITVAGYPGMYKFVFPCLSPVVRLNFW